MPQRLGVSIISLAPIVFASAGCGKDQIQGPAAEVKKSDIKVELPAVPDFSLPAAPSDGSHTVKELRVKGKKLFDTDITVHGYVTWVYDCATAIRKPGETDQQVQDRIDSPKIIDPATKKMEGDPTLCQRPKFYIGDSKDTPPEKSLWIVDVPRPYNRQELKNVEKKDRHPVEENKCDPADKKDPKKWFCPPYTVGDEVTVTGTFKTASPHGDSNSDGLLVYKKMHNATANWDTPDLPPPNPAGGEPSGATGPAGGKPSPEQLVHPKKG
jgi:hypothetical protein